MAFDGDGDRLGVVTKDGEIIYPDRQLMLFAADVLSRVPGGQIIYDVKCTRLLAPWIAKHGGVPLMWNTGHALVKAKLKETGAPLAGEMSGHTFFKERWYGFDDGLYTGARLLEILSRAVDGNPVLKNLPNSPSPRNSTSRWPKASPSRLIDKLKAEGKFTDARPKSSPSMACVSNTPTASAWPARRTPTPVVVTALRSRQRTLPCLEGHRFYAGPG
jgi:phosphomannomutase/phosphoglucomutase